MDLRRGRLDEERRRFLTYFNYVSNLAMLLRDQYGEESEQRLHSLSKAMESKASGIQGKDLSKAEMALAKQNLRCALSNLDCLQREATSKDFFEVKNAWTPVQTWYSVHHAMCALARYTSPQRRPSHKRSIGDAAQLISDRDLLPYPWSAFIIADHRDEPLFEYHRFRRQPRPINPLSRASLDTFDDHYALMLETTAKREAERTFSVQRTREIRPGRRRRNVNEKMRRRTYKNLGPVTMFNALYRLRLRANYGDVDTFVVGSDSPTEAQQFTRSLLILADTTVTVIENLIKAYAGKAFYSEVLTDSYSRHGESRVIGDRLKFLD